MSENEMQPIEPQPAEPLGRRVRRAIGVSAVLMLAIGMIAAVAYFAVRRNTLAREIGELTNRRDRLQTLADQFRSERGEAQRHEQILLEVLRHCRTADDIPELNSRHIVAKRQGMETLALYVPEGRHTLEIDMAWKPSNGPEHIATSAGEPPRNDHGKAIGSGLDNKSWRVTLVPRSGYVLKIETDRREGPVAWKLTANHPDAAEREETVLGRFSHRGSSWSGIDVVQFPNQLHPYSIGRDDTVAEALQGVDLMTGSLFGTLHDQTVEIDIRVRLVSDGPATVSASDAQRLIILRRADLLLPYKGGGKYELRPVSSESSPSAR